MSQYEDDMDQQQQQDQDSSVIRALREKAEKAEKLERELQQLQAEKAAAERRAALIGAMDAVGIDQAARDRFAKLADKFLEGDLDEGKVRDLATEYGFLTVDSERQEEAQRIEQVAAAHQGATVPAVASRSEAARKLVELRDRVAAGDRNVTQAEIIAAAQAAGVGIDASIETVGDFSAF